MLRLKNQIPSRIITAPILMVAIMILLTAGKTFAQTCRVSIGTTHQGHASFMEVYEYDYVTDKPSYPGGDCQLMQFINETRKYPEKAYQAGVQGRVTCSFIVNANGTVSHIKVIKSVEESLNQEAIRILSQMPTWNPGRVDGRPVPVRVIRSIPFRR